MSRVRWFLVWLLALALPLQGFAASAMQHCRPGQGVGHHAQPMAQGPGAAASARFEAVSHGAARLATPAHHPHEHPGHAQRDGGRHGHPQEAQGASDGVRVSMTGDAAATPAPAFVPAASAAQDAPPEATPPAAPHLDADHRCSACAACCAAFAFPARSLMQVVEPVRVFGALGPAADAPRFLTSGPERPPRSLDI